MRVRDFLIRGRLLIPARLPGRTVSGGLGLCCALLWSGMGWAAAVEVAVLKFGTVNWELSTMKAQGFDRAAGFDLRVRPLAGMSATRTALKSGDTDVIVADWMWVSRQRDLGEKLQFIPYSASVGKLMLARDSEVRSLADLRGKKIGIAGGPVSKGWLLLRALAARQGLDLKAETEQVYGAPPLLNANLAQGKLDAVVTFWHFAARLEGEGYRPLYDLMTLGRELGLASDLPMLGYVFREAWARQNPDLVAALSRASSQTKAYLASDPAAWEALRPLMKAESDAIFEQLRDGYLAGTPEAIEPRHLADADRMFALLAELGGEKLVGDSKALNPDTFWRAIP